MSTHDHDNDRGHDGDHNHPRSPHFPPPPTTASEDREHKSPPLIPKFDLGEDIDLVIGVTATALAGDQLFKAAGSEHHRVRHLVKAGLGAAAAVTAFKMMEREHDEKRRHHERDESEDGEEKDGGRHHELSHRNLATHDARAVREREREEDRRGEDWGVSHRQGPAWESREREKEREGRRSGSSDEYRAATGSPLRRERHHRSPSPSPHGRRHSPGYFV